MAFDRPIEADRIDDFSLFSAFVRAPLWIISGMLGGGSSSQSEDDEPDEVHHLDCNGQTSQSQQGSYKGIPVPVRVVSDYDVACLGHVDAGGETTHNNDQPRSSQTTSESEGCSGASIDIDMPRGLKRAKNLSWSDESGRSLVEFNDQVSLKQNKGSLFGTERAVGTFIRVPVGL
jgi:hypothetical protein